ncbi:MAG: peptidylprolyl isomerase [Proteobacteria bacterium]|nr:peptidylprolyl isomerase [Pseudomonadota bacterium]
MRFTKLTAAAAIAVALVAAPPALAQSAEGVAAIVNDHVISTFDVRQRAILLLVSAGMQQTPELMRRASAQALNDLINERLEIEEAAKFHIEITDDQVNRRLADIASQNHLTVDTMAQQLGAAGASIQSLRNQLQANLAWERLMQGMYGSRVRVSENEIRTTQERIAANASRPQYLLSEIFLPAHSEQEFTDMQAGAMHLLEQMQHGAPFPLVARQFSQAPSAATGGDLGWIASTALDPQLQPVAAQLQQGQVSLPIRTQEGVYIIAMRDRREGAAAGATSQVNLKEVTIPRSRQNALERMQRRAAGCADLDRLVAGVDGVNVIDLGQTSEADLSPAMRDRINGVAVGHATAVQQDGDNANFVIVCSRQTGGGGVPTRDEIEQRLRGEELAMLAERYLRNLRREALIITRN